MSSKKLQPGEYTKAQLLDVLGISPASLERYRQKFKIKDKKGPGRAKILIVSKDSAKLLEEYLKTLVSRPSGPEDYLNDSQRSSSDTLQKHIREDVRTSSDKIETYSDGYQSSLHSKAFEKETFREIYELEKTIYRLEGDLKESKALLQAKDEILKAKDQELEANRRALEALESSVKSLQASMLVIQRDNQSLRESLNPPTPTLEFGPVESNKHKPFWKKFLGK